MTKVAFCIMTNRPDKLKRLQKTLHNALVPGVDYIICISGQSPFQENDKNWEELFKQHGEVRYHVRPTRPGLFNYAEARLQSFAMASDVDYIVAMDDDFKFSDGSSTNLYQFSAGERILECLKYLEQTPSCGMVLLKGFLGGSKSGRKILPMARGFFEMGVGMVFRGASRPFKNIIDPHLVVPGALEDSAMSFTVMMNGQYVAKAPNSNIHKDPTKKVSMTDKPEYSLQYIESEGIIARINELFGGRYKLGKTLPAGLVKRYRETATKRGYEVIL